MRSWFVDKLGADTGSLGDAEALKFGGSTESGNLQANNVKVLGELRQDPNVVSDAS